MDIVFDFKGDPIGGRISNYLLEKSRVVKQGAGERSFHIFYQVLAGSDDATLKNLMLRREVALFALLNKSGCSSVPSVNDVKDYEATITAMQAIGLDHKEQRSIVRLPHGLGEGTLAHR
jgi:myosin I